MESIIQLLHSVLSQPKHATLKLQQIMSQNENFLESLAETILSQHLDPLLLKAAITTFNVVSMRVMAQVTFKNFFSIAENFRSLKRILFSSHLCLRDKKILLPCLKKYLLEAEPTLKEVSLFYQEAKESHNADLAFLLLEIFDNEAQQIPSTTQLSCIQFLLPICSDLIYNHYLRIVNRESQSQRVESGQGSFSHCAEMILLFLNTVQRICSRVFPHVLSLTQKNEPNRLWINEVISDFYQDEKLLKIVVHLIGWKNAANDEFDYIWLEDLHESEGEGSKKMLLRFHEINSMKAKSFAIVAEMLKVSDKNYNLAEAVSPVFSNLASMCARTLAELIKISGSFSMLCPEFRLNGLCKAMFQFLAACVHFIDLAASFQQIQPNELFYLVLPFLRAELQTCDKLQFESEKIAHILGSMCGNLASEPMQQFSVSHFIRNCCTKIDYFPRQCFNICFHSLVGQLSESLQSRNMAQEDYYLGIFPQKKGNYLSGKYNNQVYLLGLLTLQQQILLRKDFKQQIQSFLQALDFNHFTALQQSLLLFLVKENFSWIFSGHYIHQTYKVLSFIFQTDEEDESLFMIAMAFLENFYCQFLLNNKNQDIWEILEKVHENFVWQGVLQNIKSIKNIQFWETLLFMVKSKEKITQRVSEEKITFFEEKVTPSLPKTLYNVIVLCLERQKNLLKRQNHDQLLWMKIHYVISESYQSILEIVYHQKLIKDAPSNNLILSPYISMLKCVLNDQEEYFLQKEEIKCFFEIIAFFISQDFPIEQELCEILMIPLLECPFGEDWLICICQFTHLIHARFSIDELEKIIGLVASTIGDESSSELKINEISLFSLVILFESQPENWAKVHQSFRVKLLKGLQQLNLEELNQKGEKKFCLQKISVMRIFHVYLFGFKLEPAHEILAEVIDNFQPLIESYSIIEVGILIESFRSSYRYLDENNLKKLFQLILEVLKKLQVKSEKVGQYETPTQRVIRLMSQKIMKIFAADPYQEFKLLLRELDREGIIPTNDDFYNTTIKSIMNVETIEGQPRKMFRIVAPREQK